MALEVYQPASPSPRPEPSGSGQERAAHPPRLGEKCLAFGLISAAELDEALAQKIREPQKRLGSILLDMGFVDERALAAVTGDGLKAENTRHALVDPDAVGLLPEELALAHLVLPLASQADTVTLAVAAPPGAAALAALKPHLPAGARIELRRWEKSVLKSALDSLYVRERALAPLVREAANETNAAPGEWSNAIVRLVNAMFVEAIRCNAGAIHLDPAPRALRLSYRLDGALHFVAALPSRLAPLILAELRRLAETAQPVAGKQGGIFEGVIALSLGERDFDCRLSGFPARHGDALVLALTEPGREPVPLDRAGFSERARAALKRVLERPGGLVLVAGPRRSGRTASLYAMLDYAAGPHANALALVRRPQFRAKNLRECLLGETLPLAAAIRAAAAQDYDLLLVDDVTDEDEACAAFDAALSGARVFASLSANDTLSALARLLAFGIPPAVLAGNLAAIVSQRLARRLCPVCKEARPATQAEMKLLGLVHGNPPQLHHPVGCPYCRATGFKGRLVIAEILRFDERLNDALAASASRAGLLAAARQGGFRALAEDGASRVLAGEISPAELVRCVDMTERL